MIPHTSPLRDSFSDKEIFSLNKAKILLGQELPSENQNAENFFVRIAKKDCGDSVSLLGVKAVIAESFECQFRSDLIGMGIIPLLFKFGMNHKSLLIEGDECLDFLQLSARMKPGMDVLCRMTRKTGEVEEFGLSCAIETQQELATFNEVVDNF